MIGGEFAQQLSPLAGLRVLSPFNDMACDVCGAPHAVCRGDAQGYEQPLDVEALVTERAAAQVRRPPGRPPKDPAKRAVYDAAITSTGGVIDGDGRPVDEAPRPTEVPVGDPTEVRDLYVVPEGRMDPVDDPHRPDPQRTVLVSDRSQLYDTGAWMTLPGGERVATTREVLQVHWPMGCVDPSYKRVAALGKVLAHPRLVT